MRSSIAWLLLQLEQEASGMLRLLASLHEEVSMLLSALQWWMGRREKLILTCKLNHRVGELQRAINAVHSRGSFAKSESRTTAKKKSS